MKHNKTIKKQSSRTVDIYPKINPCPKCNCKKIEIVSTPMQMTPDKSQYQATCTKKTCKWRGAWSSTEESAISGWNNFNSGIKVKK